MMMKVTPQCTNANRSRRCASTNVANLLRNWVFRHIAKSLMQGTPKVWLTCRILRFAPCLLGFETSRVTTTRSNTRRAAAMRKGSRSIFSRSIFVRLGAYRFFGLREVGSRHRHADAWVVSHRLEVDRADLRLVRPPSCPRLTRVRRQLMNFVGTARLTRH